NAAVLLTATRGIAVTEHTEQQERITLPLARLRWLQEMGVAPALLRPYAPGHIATSRTQPTSSIHAQANQQTQPTAHPRPGRSNTVAPDPGQQRSQQGARRGMCGELLRSMRRPQQAEHKRAHESKSSRESKHSSEGKQPDESKRAQSPAAPLKKDS